MARTSATISVGADTRQLERDIQSALSRDFKFKGINEKAFTQPLGRITGAANEFQKSLDASNARVIAFGASAGLIYTVERAFTDLIRSTVEVQKSLTDINVILNTTTQGLAKFGGEVFNIAKNTGQSFQAVAQAATEFARQGLGVEETLKRTRDALVLTRLSGLDVVSSVEALTATVNSFNKVALDSTTVINKLANVDAAFAVSSADLANAISRVGSSAQDAGVSFDELLGIVTSVQQTTARGGAVIGNSLKTIFTRIQRTDVLDQLQALGINVRDLEGNTLPALQILQELGTTFDTLADSQRAQVAESVGGVFQINVLKAALGDLGKEYSIYERALKTSTSSTDEAIKRNEALNETVAALFNRTVANVTQLSAAFGAGAFQPAIESTLKNINKVLEFIANQDSESIGGKLGEGILKGLSTFVSGPGLVLITAVIGKLTLDLAKFATSGFRALLGINQQAEARAQLQTKINQVLSQEPQLLAAINAKQISVLSVENQILKILREQNTLRSQAAALSTTITSSLIRQGVGVKGGQITTKSSGFIPNYALSEVYGALAGGYKPGKIKEMNISGEGRVIYNSAEKVKKFAGMSQPAIIPPQNSKAGKNYKDNFIKKNGFDPYASNGYIPNFITNAFSENVLVSEARQQYRFRRLINQGYQPLRGEEAERAMLRSNEGLFRNGTLVLEGGQVFVKSGARGLITQQLREKEKLTAGARGEKEGSKLRRNYVLVYPSTAGGPSMLTGGNTKNDGSYRFSAYPFPGGDTAVPDQLYRDATTSLIQNAKNYISSISTRPQLVQSANFENYVRGNLSRSAIEATVGQVFESAIKASLNRISTSEINTFDLNQNELYALSKRFKNTEELGRFTFGDLKNSLSEGNLDSFAEKIARTEGKGVPKKRTKSKGFIPNFTALGEAIKREVSAGIPMSKVRIGQDNRLMSKYNPLGVGVYNTEDEPNGIKQGIASQRSIIDAKKAGAFYEGFIPNFARFLEPDIAKAIEFEGLGAEGLAQLKSSGVLSGTLTQYSKEAEREFKSIVNSLRDQKISLQRAQKEATNLASKYNLSNQSVQNMNTSLSNVASTASTFNNKIKKLESSAGGIFGRGLGQLETLAQKPGTRGLAARGALERAQERRQASLGRLQGAGIGLSIGAPIIAQTIAASRPGDKNAQAVAEGLGTFASFAGAGALFGPLGIAIGGTIGALVGFKKALDTVNSRSEEFARQAQESQNNLSRFSEDVQTFLNTRTQVEGLRTGEIRGTQAELSRVEKTQTAALARIFNSAGPEITSQIKSALESGNEELLRESLGRATIAKESANSIDQFTDKIIQLKEKGDLSKTFNENIIAFGNLRTRSGETFAELFSKNESLIASLNGYANAVELVSLTTSEGIQDLEQSLQDPLSALFVNLSRFEGGPRNVLETGRLPGPRSVLETGKLPFSEEQITKKIRDLENAYAESVDGLTSQLTSTIPADFLTRTQESKRAFALQSLATDLANESLKGFNQEIDSFVTNLVDAKKITEKNGSDIKLTFKTILEGPGDPKEKIQKIIEEFKVLGEQGEVAAKVLENISKGLFTFSQLSSNLRQLFLKGGDTEEGQGKAAQQRSLAAQALQRANFADLLKDPELFREFLPESVLTNLIKSTGAKIAGGTQEQEKRDQLFTEFGEEFKSELSALAQGAQLTDEQFAKLRAGAERAGEKAVLTSDNLFLLNKSISDSTLRQEAVNEYKRIEAELTKKLNGNIDLLGPAARNAAEELATIQKARLGQLFLEEKNQRLLQGAYSKIKTPGLFEGLDIEEMTARTTADYEKIITDLTNEGITSINSNIFDEQAKILAKERLKALEQEQLSLIRTQGGLSTRQLSDVQARYRQLASSNASLKEGFDTLNSSIADANLREEAKNALETKSRDLEIQYQGNLIKLKEATAAFAEVLITRAKYLEGSAFADELKAAEERYREEKIRQGKFEATDIFGAFSAEMTYGPQDAMRDLNRIGTDTATTLKSEFNNAFQSVIDGTQEVGDAFRTMALNISRRIQQLALDMTTNLAFNSLLSSFGGVPSLFKNPLTGAKGGFVSSQAIKGYSTGGKVTGGSGVRDDVPAMLNEGEYVIKKSSVNKYGEGFMKMLNGGMIEPSATASNNMKYSETDNLSKNDYNKYKTKKPILENIKNYNEATTLRKYKDPFYGDLFSTSDRQTSLNSQDNPLFKYKPRKMALGGLMDGGLRPGGPSKFRVEDMTFETQRVNNLDKELKIMPGGMGSIPDSFERTSTGGAYNAELLSDFYYTDQEFGIPSKGRYIFDPRLTPEALLSEEDPTNRLREERIQRLLTFQDEIASYKEYLRDLDERNAQEQARINQLNQQNRDNYNKQQRNMFWGSLLQAGMAVGGGTFSQYGLPALKQAFGGSSGWSNWRAGSSSYGQSMNFAPPSQANRYNLRGTVPSIRRGYAKGGSVYKDTIPALLMDGEYVIKKDMVNLYGRNFFDRLNSGRIQKFAEGGSVGVGSTESIASPNNGVSNTNNINITVNVNQASGTSNENNSQQQGESKGTTDQERQEELERNRKLSERIKSEVVKVINQEQRPGGLLSSSKYKMA